jgi:hypothetical protein
MADGSESVSPGEPATRYPSPATMSFAYTPL